MVGVLVGCTEGPATYRTNIFINPGNLGLALLLVVEIFLVSVVDHNTTKLASVVFYLFIPVALWVFQMNHFDMSLQTSLSSKNLPTFMADTGELGLFLL